MKKILLILPALIFFQAKAQTRIQAIHPTDGEYYVIPDSMVFLAEKRFYEINSLCLIIIEKARQRNVLLFSDSDYFNRRNMGVIDLAQGFQLNRTEHQSGSVENVVFIGEQRYLIYTDDSSGHVLRVTSQNIMARYFKPKVVDTLKDPPCMVLGANADFKFFFNKLWELQQILIQKINEYKEPPSEGELFIFLYGQSKKGLPA